MKKLMMMGAMVSATFAAGALQTMATCDRSEEPVKVILDTDMLTEFDDVGVLACLHALADA